MRPASPQAVKLLHDGSLVHSDMESVGIKIDVDYLDSAIEKLKGKITSLESDLQRSRVFKLWKKKFGDKTKLGNRQQMATILFDVMNHPYPGDKEKHEETGRYSADEEILKQVKEPFCKEYLKIEKLKKVKNTYLMGIKSELTSEAFIHPFWNLHLATTYRPSCDSPNVQNQPKHDEEFAKLVRRAFIPRSSKRRLVEIDLKGAEVCTAACYNHDPKLIEYIKNPKLDMHRDLAMQILKRDTVTDNMRYVTKNSFTFATFYGSYYAQIAPILWREFKKFKVELPFRKYSQFEKHLQTIEHDFWHNRFKVYNQWREDWWDKYLQRGWARTLTGFVLQGLQNKNDIINYPIQGSSFHCLLWFVIQMNRWLKKNRMKSVLIMEIHDSAVADVVESEREDYFAKAKELITVDLPKAWSWICVPFTPEMEMTDPGESWYDKKKVKL
jgi:DNA polymerase I